MYNLESKIVKFLYKHSPGKVRHILEYYVCKREKGYFWSKTLREIYKEHYGLKIGVGTYGCFKPGVFPRGCEFGNYTSVANNVRFLNGNHPINYASMHPMFYNKNLGYVKEDTIIRSNLKVGHDVWIGYGVTILSKCNYIGNGAVIAAGSVVTKDVDPYTIVAGVPAKVIGKRFSDDIIKQLEETQWYYLQPELLGTYIDYVESPERFIEKMQSNTESPFRDLQ